MSDIIVFEQLAHSVANALALVADRNDRNRLAARLARLDQIIAARKDRAGILGFDTCTYLEGRDV